jgi:ribosomal protein S20
MNNLYSIIDKAVKKQVIHRNNAARKKSNLHKLSQTFDIN